MPEDTENRSSIYRIKDAPSARRVYQKMWEDDELRQKTRATVRAQLEGEKPFSDAHLQERGELWRCNHNFRQHEAAANRAELPYWEMVHSAPTTISVTVKSKSSETERWNKALEEAFDEFLDDWGADYKSNYGRVVKEYVRFGAGYARWEDDSSARFTATFADNIIFPKSTPTEIGRWEVVAIRHSMSPSELYKKWKQSKGSKDTFWNPDMVEAAIRKAKSDSTDEADADEWSKMQDEIVGNDLTASIVWPSVDLVTLYVRGDKGVEEYIFLRECGGSEYKKEKDAFLFKRKGYYKTLGEVIGPVFWGNGEEKIHHVKGFAVRNYGLGVLTDRTLCRLVDGSTLSMSMNFVRGNDAADDAPPIENYGAVNVFATGLQQQAVYPRMNEGMGVLQVLEMTSSENNSQYRETQKQIQDTETATQANILAAMEARVSQANAALYLVQIGDNIYSPMFRKLIKKGNDDEDAKKFRERASERGVPERVLDGEFEIRVKMGASPSSASAAIRQLLWRELLPMASMPGVNGRWILQNFFASRLGAYAVDKVLPPDGGMGKESAVRMAIIENDQMTQGMPMPVPETDDHIAHVEQHLAPFEQAVGKQVNDGEIDPELAPFVQFAAAHLAEHFEILERDETLAQQADPFRERYVAARNAARGLITRLGNQQNERITR